MRRVPELERCDLHRDAVRSGHAGHPRVRLNADHLAAPREEQASHFACPATNVEHSGRLAGQQFIDQRGRVRRARPIVALGVLPEGLRTSAILVVFRYQVGPG
jgi:hypothetical protein